MPPKKTKAAEPAAEPTKTVDAPAEAAPKSEQTSPRKRKGGDAQEEGESKAKGKRGKRAKADEPAQTDATAGDANSVENEGDEDGEGRRISQRPRKVVTPFESSIPASKSKKELVVPQGPGLRLGDIPLINRSIESAKLKDEIFKSLFTLVFGRGHDIKQAKQALKSFNGFVLADPDKDHDKLLSKLYHWQRDGLQELCDFLGLPRTGVKEELCDRIAKFLESPVDLGGKPAAKPAAKSSKEGGESSSEAAAEGSNDAAPEDAPAAGDAAEVPKKRKPGRPPKNKDAAEAGAPGEKKTRKRKSKEEKALKKPRGLSAFIIFRMEKGEQVRREHPEAKSAPEQSVIFGEMWKSLDPAERERYATMAAQDRERKLQEFEASGGAAAVAAALEEKKKKKAEEGGEKKPRKPRAPKGSKNAAVDAAAAVTAAVSQVAANGDLILDEPVVAKGHSENDLVFGVRHGDIISKIKEIITNVDRDNSKVADVRKQLMQHFNIPESKEFKDYVLKEVDHVMTTLDDA